MTTKKKGTRPVLRRGMPSAFHVIKSSSAFLGKLKSKVSGLQYRFALFVYTAARIDNAFPALF